MKGKNVIIFDGEDEVRVSEDEISKITNGPRVVALFQATAIYRDLSKEYLERGAINQFEYKKIDRGFRLLSEEVIRRYGEDMGLHIIANTSLIINIEKHNG